MTQRAIFRNFVESLAHRFIYPDTIGISMLENGKDVCTCPKTDINDLGNVRSV